MKNEGEPEPMSIEEWLFTGTSVSLIFAGIRDVASLAYNSMNSNPEGYYEASIWLAVHGLMTIAALQLIDAIDEDKNS